MCAGPVQERQQAALVGLPWPIFSNYNGPLLASHEGANMAAGTGPSKEALRG